MGVGYNPKIVTSGLVLCLDAANPKSYPGSGTTWTDLSIFQHQVSLVNSPSFSSTVKRFSFNGTNTYASIDSNASLTITNPTVIIGCTVAGGTVLAKGSYGQYWNYGIRGITGTRFSARNNNADLQSPIYPTSVSGLNIFAAVYNGTACVFYRNGELSGSTSDGYSPVANNTRKITIGAALSGVNNDYVEFYSGEISFIQIYNRALSAQEIQQNFNALRGRFGL